MSQTPYTPAEAAIVAAALAVAVEQQVAAGCIPMPGLPKRFVAFGEMSELRSLVRPDIEATDEDIERLRTAYASNPTAANRQAIADAYWPATRTQPIADVSAPKLPNGWVALNIVFDGEADYPEEVAYGPAAMMARLGKKLDKYYAGVITARDARTADVGAPTDDGQQGTLSIERIVRNAILGNSHPCNDGYVMFISSDEVDTVAAQVGLAARAAAPVSGPSDA